jgi:hypothetical protein
MRHSLAPPPLNQNWRQKSGQTVLDLPRVGPGLYPIQDHPLSSVTMARFRAADGIRISAGAHVSALSKRVAALLKGFRFH